MAYDKEVIQQLDKQGVFDDKMDASVLSLDDAEKEKLGKDFSKAQKDMTPASKSDDKNLKKRKPQIQTLEVELTVFEKIVAFILSVFGISSIEKYKIRKVIRVIEKDLGHIKPPIYNTSTRRITKYFAFKIHDLYLKLVWVKKIFANTVENEKMWDNPSVEKPICEALFEKMADINMMEIDDNFSNRGLELVVSQFEDPKKAVETIEKSLYSYVYSIDKTVIHKANQAYTNLMYFNKLTKFDFVAFFKRFDQTYHPGVSPNFIDISGDALVNYLKELEEAILQIDLNFDNISLFKKLNEVALDYYKKSQIEETSSEKPLPAGMDAAIQSDLISPEKLETELIMLFEILKDLLYKKYLTLLIQIIKADPLYTPSLIHTRFDLFNIYLETFEKRIKGNARKIIKDRRTKKIEGFIRKLYPDLMWVGVYNKQLSEDLETAGYIGLGYSYHLAIVYTFVKKYYGDLIKTTLNILMLNGVFSEKNFHKLLSDSFYAMDKFAEKLEVFAEDMKPEGASGKRLLMMLSRKNNYQPDQKKTTEKQIVAMNGIARDLIEEFWKLYGELFTIISSVYRDIDLKPPKYVRNIRAIGGFRNVKFLQSIEKSYQILTEMDDIVRLLKET